MSIGDFTDFLTGASKAFDTALTTYEQVTSQQAPIFPGYAPPAPVAAGGTPASSFFFSPVSMLLLALAGVVLVVATILAFRKRH